MTEEELAKMTRVLQIMFLPLLILALPLLFATAWIHEAVSDLSPGSGRSIER